MSKSITLVWRGISCNQCPFYLEDDEYNKEWCQLNMAFTERFPKLRVGIGIPEDCPMLEPLVESVAFNGFFTLTVRAAH